MAVQTKLILQQLLIYSLAIIVWVCKFLTPVLGSFFSSGVSFRALALLISIYINDLPNAKLTYMDVFLLLWMLLAILVGMYTDYLFPELKLIMENSHWPIGMQSV